MTLSQNDNLKARAQKVIPNGMYGHMSVRFHSPRTPQFFSKGKGAHVWDYDGQKYIDYLCAYGPSLLGYAHAEIDAVYTAQLKNIDTGVGPSAHMVELAENYTQHITHADWTMFCKNGTDATTMALMTARAYRGRKTILLAMGAYHGATTWCTPLPEGTVPESRAHFIYYEYNNVESLAAAVEQAGDELAGIFATPFRHEVIEPNVPVNPAYAKAARAHCDAKDALLILDDVRAGFRINRDCSWTPIGVQPDLSTWGKSLANGHAISCLMGSDRAREAAGKIFVTGSFWFGAASMAAAIKTLEIIQSTDYLEESIRIGDKLRHGINDISQRLGRPIHQTGPSQMPLIMMNTEAGERDLGASVALCDGLLDHGVLFHPIHNMFITNAMSDDDITQTLSAVETVVKALPADNSEHAAALSAMLQVVS